MYYYVADAGRFFSIQGFPAITLSDNGSQMTGAAKELCDMLNNLKGDQLRESCSERSIQQVFTTPAAPHQNRCIEALVKSYTGSLKKAINEQVLTPFKLYTCLLEVVTLVDQCPIGRVPDDPDDSAYFCPNDILLERATPEPFNDSKNLRH